MLYVQPLELRALHLHYNLAMGPDDEFAEAECVVLFCIGCGACVEDGWGVLKRMTLTQQTQKERER